MQIPHNKTLLGNFMITEWRRFKKYSTSQSTNARRCEYSDSEAAKGEEGGKETKSELELDIVYLPIDARSLGELRTASWKRELLNS